MYANGAFITFVMVACVAMSSARTIGSRGLGDIQLGDLGSVSCNAARLQILGAMGDTQDSVDKIQDPAVQTSANAGLTMAKDGIGQIAKALFAGEAAPASGRDQVQQGLTATGTALNGGNNSTDAAVADARTNLAKATKAGQDVVAKC